MTPVDAKPQFGRRSFCLHKWKEEVRDDLFKKGGDGNGNERRCFKTASAIRNRNERQTEDELMKGKHGQRRREFWGLRKSEDQIEKRAGLSFWSREFRKAWDSFLWSVRGKDRQSKIVVWLTVVVHHTVQRQWIPSVLYFLFPLFLALVSSLFASIPLLFSLCSVDVYFELADTVTLRALSCWSTDNIMRSAPGTSDQKNRYMGESREENEEVWIVLQGVDL